MSTVKANNVQVGQSGTATNNFTLYQPSSPDGTVRLAVGNSGATTGDVLSVSSTGLSVTGTLTSTGVNTFPAGSASAPSITTTGDTNTGVFFPAADTAAITTGGSERMRITSAGNVGIGTSSPSQRLSVHGPSYGGPATSGTTQTNGAIRITAPGTTGILDIGIGVSGTNQWIQSCDSGNLGTSYNLLLNPNGGSVLIGTSSANGQLCVTRNSYYSPAIYVSIDGTTGGGGNFATLKQTSGSYGNAYITIDRGRNDYLAGFEFLTGGTLDFTFGCGGNPGVGGGNSLQLRNSSGTRVFDINSSNGNVQNQNNSYGSLSDVKLKENITNATPKLEKLNELRVVNYNLIGDSLKQIGLIAQEVELVFPGLVETQADVDGDGNDLGTTTKAVKYSVFVPMLIQAVQELKAIVDAQAARISALEAA